MTWLREDDGTLSPLADVALIFPKDGVYLCTREDGSVILASADDLTDDLTEPA